MHVIARCRRIAATPGRDAGFTLVEMLVVTVLLGVVGGIVLASASMAMRTTRQHQNRSYAAEDVQTQLERLARDVRVADPIRAASASSITVDVYPSSTTCTREVWTASGSTLTVTRTSYGSWSACSKYPATATPTGTTTTTPLAALTNGATPVFTYTDPTGNAMATPTLSKIAVVGITLVETPAAGGSGTVSFTTSVGVRNEALS